MIRVQIQDVELAGYNQIVSVEWGTELPEELATLDIQRDGGERYSTTTGRTLVQYLPEITPNATIFVNAD